MSKPQVHFPLCIPTLDDFGGLEELRAIISELYSLIFDDPMISYLFVDQDIERLIDRELEWTAKALGAPVKYQGRSMSEAHRKHPIRRGHFHRRNQLLEEAMQTRGLNEQCKQWWRSHSLSMQNAILGAAHTDPRCEETANKHSSSTSKLWTSS